MAAKKKTTIDTAKLTRDLVAARQEAEEALKGQVDGGTSNLDYCGVLVPNTKAVNEAIKAAGFDPSPAYGILKGFVRLGNCPGMCKQGSMRTLGAETVMRSMEAAGWRSSMYYAMD